MHDTTTGISHARRRLGKSSLVVAPIAWGMWGFKGEDLTAARTLLETAIETGVELFDTADIYGAVDGEGLGAAESLLGRVLAEAPILRQRMVIATKAGVEIGTPYNTSASYLIGACEASLTRLGLDHVELFQIHRNDFLAHPAEVARALDRLREDGKIREAGVSNYSATQVAALQAHLPFPLATIQAEFSPLAITGLSDGTLDQAMELGLSVLAWSPLAGGKLANPETEREKAVVHALTKIAERASVPVTVASYAWILAHPAHPIPIVGSQKPERIREAALARNVHLTRAEWYEGLTASRGEPLP
jgi:predicted oxidoreductase